MLDLILIYEIYASLMDKSCFGERSVRYSIPTPQVMFSSYMAVHLHPSFRCNLSVRNLNEVLNSQFENF